MSRDPTIALRDILRELAFLKSIAETHSFEIFSSNAMAYRAASYSIQTLRHEYFRLDDAILWRIIVEEGPALNAAMSAMLARHSA